MQGMGPAQALGFAAPLAYFIFIILSTLRLDFWLSSFTGLVAAAELLAMAMFYHPAQFAAEPAPDFGYHLVRSVIILICGILAGAVGMQLRRQFEASIAAATARDRVTNLFGQHVSPQVVERLLAVGHRRHQRDPPCRHHVRRFPQFHRRAPGSGRRSRWWRGSTTPSPCWSRFWTGIPAS